MTPQSSDLPSPVGPAMCTPLILKSVLAAPSETRIEEGLLLQRLSDLFPVLSRVHSTDLLPALAAACSADPAAVVALFSSAALTLRRATQSLRQERVALAALGFMEVGSIEAPSLLKPSRAVLSPES